MIDASHDEGASRIPLRCEADSEELEGVQENDESDDESGEDGEHGPANKKVCRGRCTWT